MEGALSSSPSAKSSSSVNSTPGHLCLIKGMPKEDLPPQKKASGNPYPRRGQIKAGIFASIVKTVASLATTKVGGKKKENGGGPQRKTSGNPYPRRGQIKAGIFASIVKTVASLATTKVGGKEREKGGGQGSSAFSTPPPSRYSSEGNSDG